MQIHVAKNGQQTGPFEEAQIREKLAAGEFAPTDLAWHADLAGWQPLSTLFPEAAAPAAAAPEMMPPAASPVAALPVFPSSAPASPPPYAPPSSMPSPVGGGYAPLAVAGAPGQLPPPQFYNPTGVGVVDPNLASLGSRFLAFVVDFCILFIAYLPAIVFGSFRPNEDGNISSTGIIGLVLTIGLALAIAGVQIYLLSTSGQTIGKRVAKVRVVMLDGSPAGFVKAFLMRGFVGYLPSVIPCVGSIYAIVDICFIFRQDRRCIHDLIAGTKVVQA